MNEIALKLCDIQGRLFELSADHNYVSVEGVVHPFVKDAQPNSWQMSRGNICIFTGSNMAGKSTTLKAVSYTHLDVYKRQEVQTAGVYERLKYAVIIRAIGMMILYALTAAYANQRMPCKYLSTWICIMPVSYTHLDVYKRQIH